MTPKHEQAVPSATPSTPETPGRGNKDGQAPADGPRQRPTRAKHYHGHRKRLRDKLLQDATSPRDDEILELLLGYVILRSDTKPIAKALLSRFGSLRGVLDARPDEYQDIPGIGEGVVAFVLLLREFVARHAESRVRSREQLCTPESVARMARERLGRLAHEELWVAYLDNGNRLLCWEKASQGVADASMLDARGILHRAAFLHARSFIVVHNHPGGSCRPSGADLEMTRFLKRGAQSMGVRFLDHVVVTNDEQYSIMTEGFL